MEEKTLPFAFLKEDEYLQVMESECAAWLDACVHTEDFKSFDGVRLRGYYGIPQDAKACVVMVHGFCEFFGKYHEMAWYLYRAGYAFFFLEQRGHGFSGGKLLEADVVHIDDFSVYVEDLRAFLDEVVDRHSGGLQKTLFGHSMGGAVSALFLETYPDVFDRVLFSSPMFALKKLKLGRPVCSLLRFAAKAAHRLKTLAPAEHYFDEMEAFDTSSMLSRAHYDYMFALRMKEVHNRSYGASLGWALAAADAMRLLNLHADRITIPVTIFSAGRDGLVDINGFEVFRKKVPQTRIIHYENAKHELCNALDEERLRFYGDLFRILEEQIAS